MCHHPNLPSWIACWSGNVYTIWFSRIIWLCECALFNQNIVFATVNLMIAGGHSSSYTRLFYLKTGVVCVSLYINLRSWSSYCCTYNWLSIISWYLYVSLPCVPPRCKGGTVSVVFNDTTQWSVLMYECGGGGVTSPDSKVQGANMGPIWGRQDPGGPHVGPMNFAIWGSTLCIGFGHISDYVKFCTKDRKGSASIYGNKGLHYIR